MTRLRSCAACARHVFATEPVCPFCLTQLAPAPEPAQVAIPSGASRAQRLALAAAISGSALIGCAQPESDQAQPIGVAGSSAPSAGRAAPPANAAAGRAAPPDRGMAVPVYGAPLPDNRPPVAQGGRAAPPVAGRGAVVTPVYGAPVAGSPAADEDAGVPEAGSAAPGSGSGGHVAVPVYGAPLPEYGAPPPPKD